MGKSVWFRCMGGLIVVPISWVAVGRYGLSGAAVGALVSGAAYILLVCLFPGGCLNLIREARRAYRRAGQSD